MHWNVAPDALPGSVRFVRVLDRWRNDCGRKVFGKNTYTFWITFSEKDYTLPRPGFRDYEAQIVCGIPQSQ